MSSMYAVVSAVVVVVVTTTTTITTSTTTTTKLLRLISAAKIYVGCFAVHTNASIAQKQNSQRC